MLAHGIWGKLNLCCQALLTHICLHNNSLFSAFPAFVSAPVSTAPFKASWLSLAVNWERYEWFEGEACRLWPRDVCLCHQEIETRIMMWCSVNLAESLKQSGLRQTQPPSAFIRSGQLPSLMCHLWTAPPEHLALAVVHLGHELGGCLYYAVHLTCSMLTSRLAYPDCQNEWKRSIVKWTVPASSSLGKVSHQSILSSHPPAWQSRGSPLPHLGSQLCSASRKQYHRIHKWDGKSALKSLHYESMIKQLMKSSWVPMKEGMTSSLWWLQALHAAFWPLS